MTQETSIDWQEAQRLLGSGQIVAASQSHSLRVTLTDAAGKRYVTHQPRIDAIITAIQALEPDQRSGISLSSE